jgi:glutamate-1-semialdehyde 2,1-aminomutase
MDREGQTFRERHRRSGELAADAKGSLLFGVPMNWMTRWPGDHPLFVDHAGGARFWDVDGNVFVDFCLGDTGGMAGHAPKVSVDAIATQAGKGITLMLPTEDAAWVGREMARRFVVPYWNFTLTATDANRFAIRWAREVTGRSKVVVHNWCYHGSVDESFATLDERGEVVERGGNVGKPAPLDETTRVVEINDLEGLEAALAHGDVAVCMFEPALTNIGIVLPEPGYHEAVRELCTKYGTLLLIDETHTISAGPGGCTKAWGLQPDIVTIGKTLGAGIPSAAYGFSQELSERVYARTDWKNADVGGVGGTLAGNALSTAAMRATLGEVLTEDAFAHMTELATAFTAGVQATLDELDVPWSINQLGARAEYRFARPAPTTGEASAAAADEELDAYMHLAMVNRGILMTPFHNMALMCPETSPDDVDRHTAVFREVVGALFG